MASNRDLAARFSRAAGATPKPQQPEPAAPATPEETPAEPKGSKFTVIFSRSDAEDFDAFVLSTRRRLGRRVDKSEVVRALLELVYSDPSLERQLLERLQRRG